MKNQAHRVKDRYEASWMERNLQLTMKVLFNEQKQEKEESLSAEIKQEIKDTEEESNDDRNNEKEERHGGISLPYILFFVSCDEA